MLGRDLRLFLREVPAALAIAVLLGLFCALAAAALLHGTESSYSKATVAVVDEDNSFYSSLAIPMIANQDFASPLAITKASAQEAEQGLKDGSFMAVLYLPSGYADKALSGGKLAVTVKVSEAVPLQSDVVQLLCRFGEELLATGQFGVFAGEQLVQEHAPEALDTYLKKSNAKFLARALSNPGIQKEEAGFALTGVSTTDWYIVLYAMTFFQLMCLGGMSLARDVNTSMLRRLAADGVKNWEFLLGKWILLFGLYLALAATVMIGLKLPVYPLGVVPLILAMGTSAMVGLALVICLGRKHCVVAVTALTAVSLFCSGGIVPRMELPLALNRFGDFLPLGASARLAAALRSGRIHFGFALVCLGWMAISWGIMKLRLNAVRKGAA